MLIGVPKETWPRELRAALVPQNTKKLVNAGLEVVIKAGLGEQAGFSHQAY